MSSYLEIVDGKNFSSHEPDLLLYSEASLTGWEDCSDNATTRGPWTTEELLHINELEFVRAFNAIKSFANGLPGSFIPIFLDNNTTVCYLNKHGDPRSRKLFFVAKKNCDVVRNQK